MKMKVNYDTGPVCYEIDSAEVAALVLAKERQEDQALAVAKETARQKRKLQSVEVV